MKSNIEIETFKNIGNNVFSQVRRVDFGKSSNSNTSHNNEVDTCKHTNHKFKNYDFAYRSKYDATGVIPCSNSPKCSEHNYKCINDKTGYNVQDNNF
jgi:hypothetical protein